MKTNCKTILILLLLSGWTVGGWAGPVTRDQAKQKAEAFLSGNVNGNKRMAPRRGAVLRQVAQTDGYHVFNVGERNGFVIVSGSDQTQPILGYADDGWFDADNVPDALRLWLDDLQKAVKSVDQGIPQKRTLLPGRKLAKRTTKHAVPTLMSCRWNQGDPYNLQTPSYIETRQDGTTVTHAHSATGCVATAMAQVMYYWKWPKTACKSIPQYSSDWNQQRTLGPLGPTTFKWDDMTDTYDGSSSQKAKDAVAELMKYVGYSIQMGYGPASGAYSGNCGPALINYYGYAPTTQFVIHDNYTYPEWEDLIYGELALGRPVLMAGDNYERTGGHQWVCDGYDGNGLYHMNWGWGGMSDGYFLLTVMQPGAQGIGGSTASDGYSMGHNIYIGLEPPGRVLPDTDTDDEGEPRFAITGLSVDKKEYTRSNLNGIFAPKFNIRLKNELNEKKAYDLGISLYDEEGNLVMNGKNEIFANYVNIEMGAGANYSRDFSMSVRNVENGTYMMRARCRVNGETEWKDAVDNQSVYAILEVNDLTLSVTTVPVSGMDLNVNEFELMGKTTFGNQQRIRANITNNGGDYYSDTYLCVDGTRVSGNTIYIPSGATMDIYFNYTPSAGNHTFLLTQNQAKTGVTSGFFKTTINVVENTVPTVIVQQQLLNKISTEGGNSYLYTNEMRIKVTVRNMNDVPYNGKVKSSLWHYGWMPSLREQTYYVSLPARADTVLYFTYDDLEWNYDYNYHTEADGRNELVSGKYTTRNGGIQYWRNDGTKDGVAKASPFAITSDIAAIYLPINTTTPVDMSIANDFNPNLIVYYDENAVVSSRIMNNYKKAGLVNFVFGNKAENIVIDEAHPFIVGKDFTATNINYTRHLNTEEPMPTAGEEGTDGNGGIEWSTLVLPFAPQTVTDGNGNTLNWKKSSSNQQLLVKDFTAINGTQLYFSPVEEMKANRPYIIGYDAQHDELNFSAENVAVETTPMASTYSSYYKYLGTFSPVNADNIYVLSADGKAFEAVSEATEVSPFHAFFVANTPEAARAASLPIIIQGNQTPTGISSLTSNSSTKGEGSKYIYDLQGRKINSQSSTLKPGIYIINSKKVVIK